MITLRFLFGNNTSTKYKPYNKMQFLKAEFDSLMNSSAETGYLTVDFVLMTVTVLTFMILTKSALGRRPQVRYAPIQKAH